MIASAAAAASAATVGSWGPTIGFPLVPVAAALVPGNRLLVWSADEATLMTSTTTLRRIPKLRC